MRKSRNIFAVLLALSASCFLIAQPDAGTLLREQQKLQERKPLKPLPEREEPPAPDSELATAGATVVVKEFHFRGFETLAAEPELQKVVNESVGKKVGVADLQRLADRVTALLRAKGHFLARAYLPKQDVTGGIVEFAVVQARSDGGVTFNRAVEVRIHEATLRKMVDAVIKPGEPLRETELERVLLLINDLPGLVARAVLEPGALPGTTRVTANVTEGELLSGSLWADNYGNRYTGSWRGNGLVSLNDPFRMGDEANVMVSGSDGLTQGRIYYAAPIGARGLRGSVAYSDMRYKLIEGAALLNAKGSAQAFNAGASYPLIRRRAFRLSVNAGYEFAALTDKAYGFTIRDKILNTGNVGLSGDCSDNFSGGGYFSWSAVVSGGFLDLSKVKADETADKAGPRTSGSFERFNLTVSRLQHLTQRLTLSASYSGQYASGNLDSSEKFSLGGPYGVRAYPVGEASGDQGHLFNFELRQALPTPMKGGAFHLVGFLDTGHVTLNKNPWLGGTNTATGKNSYWLSGVGAGLEFSKSERYTLRANYAYKLGHNPGRSLGGMDADGRNSTGRVWLIAQVTL